MRDKKPELLVPAGGLDTLKVAVDYRRTGIWPQSESRQLFHRRDETGRGICPCT